MSADDTQQALIDAAGELFAELGFDGTSTRAIADRAGVNLGAIHYHFGGKEQLYVAAFQQACNLTQVDDAAAPALRGPLPKRGDRAAISRTILAWLRQDVESIFRRDMPLWHLRLMLSELARPSSAYDLVVERVFQGRHEHWLELYRLVRPRDDSARAQAWAFQVPAVIVFYLTARPAVERLSGRVWGEADQEAVIAQTASSMIAQLGLPPLETP